MRIRGKAFWAGMTAFALVFTGCSFSGIDSADKNPPLESRPEISSAPPVSANLGEVNFYQETHYYQKEETKLPNLDREMALLMEEGQWSRTGWIDEADNFFVVGDKLYRAMSVVREMSEEERAENGFKDDEVVVTSCGFYIQYMEPPYTTCENIRLNDEWTEDARYGMPRKLHVTEDGRMFAETVKVGDEDTIVVEEVHRDGTCVILPEAEAEKLSLNWSNAIAADSELLEKMAMVAGSWKPPYDYRENGELYFASEQYLFRYEEDGVAQLLKFSDLDILMDNVHSLQVTDEGFLIVGSYKESFFLLKLTEVAEPVMADEKEEVVLALSFTYPAIQNAVSGFNNRSEKYRVVFWEGTNDWEGYRREMQMQVSAGEGPDILGDLEPYEFVGLARNGYLASVDSLIGDGEEFLPALQKGGFVDGVRYGVPIYGYLWFLAGNRDLTGDRDRWTTEEMMAAVEKSGAQWVCYNGNSQSLLNGINIVEYMGLWDNDNKEYIDWEAGKSHLKEKPFLRLLEFAKKYAGEKKDLRSGSYGQPLYGPLLQEGSIALQAIASVTVEDLQWFEECFEGNEALIGYPRAKGSGIYFRTKNYYMNASAKCPEGAKEFLSYLLSDEGQAALTTGQWGTGLALRTKTLEDNLKLLQKETKLDNVGGFEGGIDFDRHNITDEEISRYVELAERAEPFEFYVDDIMDIVEEELEPYFADERSAEETVRILDNRVQLYLNERK